MQNILTIIRTVLCIIICIYNDKNKDTIILQII